MRKIFIPAFILFFLSTLGFSGTLTVTKPALGNDWVKGETYNITWNASGCTDTSIKINIFKDSTLQSNFVEQLTCTGCSSYSWTIPESYTTGNYVIRVKTADNLCVGDSGVFQIVEPAISSISVTKPATDDSWRKGNTYSINWSSTGCSDTSIKINIFKDSTLPANFVEQLTCTGCSSYSWTVPESYTTGNYQIRVKTSDGQCVGDSGVFQIVEPAISSISVTTPATGDDWRKGNTYRIAWNSTGCSDTSIKINIFKNSILESNFVEQLTCTGCSSYDWTIPLTYTTGNYQIRIKTSDALCVGDSNVFQITDPAESQLFVTNPHEGTGTWCIGNTHEIEWIKEGPMSENVKITLHPYSPQMDRVSDSVLTIANSTSNDNRFTWTIPDSLIEMSYIIRISTTDGKVSGDSESFHIFKKPEPRIYLSTPEEGSKYEKKYDTSSIMIQWQSINCESGADVKIMLYKYPFSSSDLIDQRSCCNDCRKRTDITSYTIYNCHYYWNIKDLPIGYYKIRLVSSDNMCKVDSGKFQIIEPLSASMTITNPNSISRWKPGSEYEIRWKRVNAHLGIILTLHEYSKGSGAKSAIVQTIVKNYPNTGKYKWKIPSDTTPGSYVVKIAFDRDNSVTDDSSPFIIGEWQRQVNPGVRVLPPKTSPIAPRPSIIKKSDLVICLETVQTTIPNQKTPLKFTVKNIGKFITVPCKLQIEADGAKKKLFTIPKINGGKSYSVTHSTIWKNAGKKKVKAVIDSTKKVNETNEKNNSLTAEIIVLTKKRTPKKQTVCSYTLKLKKKK